MKKIGMIVAMQTEILPMLCELGNAEDVCAIPCPIKRIRTQKAEIYIAQSGVGEICAASTAQLLISAFGCEELWNFGVVGGLTEEMDMNRVVIVEKVVHYAFDTVSIDHLPLGTYDWHGELYFHTDEALRKKAAEILPDAMTVTLASADRFVEPAEEKERIARDFAADICDMEGAGLAITALRNNVPILMVKAVSDSKNDGAKFNDLVCMASEKFAKVIKTLVYAI